LVKIFPEPMAAKKNWQVLF